MGYRTCKKCGNGWQGPNDDDARDAMYCPACDVKERDAAAKRIVDLVFPEDEHEHSDVSK